MSRAGTVPTRNEQLSDFVEANFAVTQADIVRARREARNQGRGGIQVAEKVGKEGEPLSDFFSWDPDARIRYLVTQMKGMTRLQRMEFYRDSRFGDHEVLEKHTRKTESKPGQNLAGSFNKTAQKIVMDMQRGGVVGIDLDRQGYYIIYTSTEALPELTEEVEIEVEVADEGTASEDKKGKKGKKAQAPKTETVSRPVAVSPMLRFHYTV